MSGKCSHEQTRSCKQTHPARFTAASLQRRREVSVDRALVHGCEWIEISGFWGNNRREAESLLAFTNGVCVRVRLLSREFVDVCIGDVWSTLRLKLAPSSDSLPGVQSQQSYKQSRESMSVSALPPSFLHKASAHFPDGQ